MLYGYNYTMNNKVNDISIPSLSSVSLYYRVFVFSRSFYMILGAIFVVSIHYKVF